MSWHRDGSHCDTPTACAARADRRRRSEQAWMDAAVDPNPETNCVSAVIETATRVRVTREVAEAACAAAGVGPGNAQRMTPIIEAAFKAAGFEVEE